VTLAKIETAGISGTREDRERTLDGAQPGEAVEEKVSGRIVRLWRGFHRAARMNIWDALKGYCGQLESSWRMKKLERRAGMVGRRAARGWAGVALAVKRRTARVGLGIRIPGT